MYTIVHAQTEGLRTPLEGFFNTLIVIPMALTRRTILNRLAWGAMLLPSLAFAPRSLFGMLLFEPEASTVPFHPIPTNPFVRDGKSVVSLIHGEDPAAMLSAAIEKLGGLEPLSLQGKHILIKPNVVNDRPPPTTTNPDVLRAVVQLVQASGAAEVTIADSSGVIRFPTRENFTTTGIRRVAEETGARLLALEEEPWVRVEPPGTRELEYYFLSKPVYDADLWINVPVVKTHRFAEYSCALKNLVGIAHPRNRPSVTFLAGDWQERIAELNLAVHPQLTIADGTQIMVEGGPTSGTAAPGHMLLASGDRVALDAVAVALIRSYGQWPRLAEGRVWEQPQIRHAARLGLGIGRPDALDLRSESLADDSSFLSRVQEIRRDLGLSA